MGLFSSIASIAAPIISGGLSLLGYKEQSKAAGRAADAQTSAQMQALDLQERMWQTGRQDLFGKEGPSIWSEARARGLKGLEEIIGKYKNLVRYPQGYKASPDFDWRRQEYENALLRAAAAGGSLDEGGTLQRFGEASAGFAAGGYQNALARLGTLGNMYSGLTGVGLGAAGQAAQIGSQYATGGANALSNIGTAQANKYINQANAQTGLYSNLGNVFNQALMMPSGGGGYQLPADIANFNPNALISNMAV